jgi:hypothetical protein
MLMIDNEAVKRVLTMRECIEAQERAFAGVLTGASVSRPRLDINDGHLQHMRVGHRPASARGCWRAPMPMPSG